MTTPIPTGNLDLEKLGLINQGLFPVDGELAQRYNGVLKTVFGLECDVSSFRVDKRGMSPELCTYFKSKHPERFEHGDSYLNIQSANRFMLVVSPDQKSAPLVAPQASYDNDLFEEVYRQGRHTIEDVTRSEALFGELENGISVYRSVEDLLGFRTVEVSLDTTRGTVKNCLKLAKISQRLGQGNNALNEDYINRMKALVALVGDVRTRAISKIFPITKEVHCFYVEFFKGVHCLRNFRNKDEIHTIFITHEQGDIEDLGEHVLALDLHDPRALDVLHKYQFLYFDQELVGPRLKEIEDEVLLSKGIDIIELSAPQRKTLITENISHFPNHYKELKKVGRSIGSGGRAVEDALVDTSYETRVRLSSPKSKDDILNHILAEIDPTDVRRLYEYNRRKLITEFPKMPLNRQRHIANVLLNHTGGKTR